MIIPRKFINWESTGNKLYRLRSDNQNLRRTVCSALNYDTERCKMGSGNCAACTDKFMDKNISRPELAAVFGVAESVIYNWETGKTPVGVENLLFYCQIADVTLDDILVYME